MNRPLTPKEIQLTQQDIAFKQAVLNDVEKMVKEILPTLVTAIVHEELDPWIDEVVSTVNKHDTAISKLINDGVVPK